MKNLRIPLEAGASAGLTKGGEIDVIGAGKTAYLRISIIRDGKETGCAWIDNGAKLRSFLRRALKRCEAQLKERTR